MFLVHLWNSMIDNECHRVEQVFLASRKFKLANLERPASISPAIPKMVVRTSHWQLPAPLHHSGERLPFQSRSGNAKTGWSRWSDARNMWCYRWNQRTEKRFWDTHLRAQPTPAPCSRHLVSPAPPSYKVQEVRAFIESHVDPRGLRFWMARRGKHPRHHRGTKHVISKQKEAR